MDDRYFFAVLVYLILTIGVSGFLPDDFYSGTHHDNLNTDEFRETFGGEIEDTEAFDGGISFFGKVLTILFVTWNIAGIPALLSLVILALNVFSIVIIAIYVYDKLRGIGS